MGNQYAKFCNMRGTWIQDQAHMHGGGSSKVEMSYKGVLDGELGMGNQ